MRRILFATLVLLGLALPVGAQTTFTLPLPSDLKVQWAHADIYAATTTEYLVGIDNGRWSVGRPVPVAGLFTAVLPPGALAALTVGTHVLTITSKSPMYEDTSGPVSVTFTAPTTPPSDYPHGPPTDVRVTITITVGK